MRGRIEFEFASLDEAQAAWERCLALDPNYVYAHVGLAKAANERGELTQAVAYWRRAVLAEPAAVAHQIELGKALLASGDVAEALSVLEGTVRAEPANPLAHAALGSAQLQDRQDAAAKDSFEKAVGLDEDHAPAHFGLATALGRLGQDELARKHQSRHAELSADRQETVRGQRVAYDDRQALQEDVARFYTEIGSVYLAQKQLAAAEQLWRRAARLDANNRSSREALAWLLVQQHKPLESILQLRELARVEPENVAYPAEIARLFGELGRLDDAEQTLQEFAQLAPDSASAQRALAEFYLGVMNEPSAAVEHAQRAAEISGAATDWVLLSAAHERASELPAAVAAMQRACELAPQNLQYRQLLALLKERAGTRPPSDNCPQGGPVDSPSGSHLQSDNAVPDNR
jgi:tetratricopeptide (TPR) repeat protein